MSTLYPDSEALPARERTVLNLYLVSTLMLFILLMVFGLTMRLAQGAWIAAIGDMKEGDQVIVEGNERVRPGQEVRTEPKDVAYP